MDSPRFISYPEKWGIQLTFTGQPRPLQEKDLQLLFSLREHFKDEEGEILSWKFDLSGLTNVFKGMLHSLTRLWENGYIVKFSGQFHTVHGNPEYIKWYIWEDISGHEIEPQRDRAGRAAGYIV